MECPKCGFVQPEERSDCPRCGLIFAKYRPREAAPFRRSEVETGTRLTDLVLAPPADLQGWGLPARGLLLLALVLLSAPLVFSAPVANASGDSVLHLINLPFHEAGHVLFRPFGRFMTTLGGSLGQLLVPLVCLGVLLLKTRDAFGAAVCLWWHGENFLDLAPYIDDARAGVMPLLGGNTGQTSPYGFHDWEYLLTETGLLHLDHTLAWLAHGVGSGLMLLAFGWAGLLLQRGYHQRLGKDCT